MLNNVSFSVTNRCNSHCSMCNIWKTKSFTDEMSVAEIRDLFSHQCFSNVDTISLTGGEPFLRNDLLDIIVSMKQCLPKLQRLFLNTNATRPNNVEQVCKVISGMFNQVILSISLDGTKDVHNGLRGIKNYDNVIRLIEIMKNIPEIRLSLSMTLSKENANIQNLQHVHDIATKENIMFSFRFADKSSTYYKNTDLDFGVSPEQKREVSQFISDNCEANEYLLTLKQFIDIGHIDLLMQDGKNKCLAGKSFVFVHPNGVISPCLYSTQKITPEQLMSGNPVALGQKEPCPCCTDCVIYPMLEQLQKTK